MFPLLFTSLSLFFCHGDIMVFLGFFFFLLFFPFFLQSSFYFRFFFLFPFLLFDFFLLRSSFCLHFLYHLSVSSFFSKILTTFRIFFGTFSSQLSSFYFEIFFRPISLTMHLSCPTRYLPYCTLFVLSWRLHWQIYSENCTS